MQTPPERSSGGDPATVRQPTLLLVPGLVVLILIAATQDLQASMEEALITGGRTGLQPRVWTQGVIGLN